MDAESLTISWVVLTMGDRPCELDAALRSLSELGGADAEVILVVNGHPGPVEVPPAVTVIALTANRGIPGGRDIGLRAAKGDIVAFLDDDAVLVDDSQKIVDSFTRSPELGAVALRLVDEDGETARRHVPRFGARGAARSGRVATFLGGACAIRRSAYLGAGGYFTRLFYGHEEVELSWRLVDQDWSIEYLADVRVRHPRTPIGRHEDGWRRTGSNRVLVARRTLPRPVALVHAAAWLLIGMIRAPGREARIAYGRGWASAWREPIDRTPIRWRTVWRLTRLGRPPLL